MKGSDLARVACLGFLAVPFQEAPGPASLLEAVDGLLAPCRFRLEYRTTLIRDDAPCFPAVRQLLRDQERQPGGSASLEALISEIRASAPVATPNHAPNLAPLYVGATTRYEVAHGRTRFLQEMVEDTPSLPVILRTSEVALLYNRAANRIDFVAPSADMDLRTLESMLSPLPLSGQARADWLSRPFHSVGIEGNGVLLVSDGEAHSLVVKCSDLQTCLPVACWTRDNQSGAREQRIACFLTYRAFQGQPRLHSIHAVRESRGAVRVDEYLVEDLEPIARDEEIVLRAAPAPDLVDRTGGKGKSRIAIADLPRSWAELFVAGP